MPFQFEASFDPKYAALINASFDSRLTASVNEVDKEKGTVKYTLTGMAALQKDASSPLIDLEFKAGETDVRALHTAFENAGVSLVLSGHDHIYNRTKMYDGQKSSSGIPYVVGGCSSGSKYYDGDSAGRPWQDVVYDDNNPVFSVLKIRDGVLSVEAYALVSGSTQKIDEFIVSKQDGNKAVLNTAKELVKNEKGLCRHRYGILAHNRL